jgi:DinB superfamily
MEVSVMKRFSALTMMMLAVLALGTPALAQTTTPKPPPTYEQVIVNTWKNLHNKILAMAKDTEYPDAKLGWKPHPDSRSVLEELRHVTIGLEMTTAVAKGEKFDFGAREKMDAGKPATRASVVQEMEAAIAASFPVVEAKPIPQLIGWLDHQGEHYGKLVTSYRVNGIVPPISRAKK